MPSKPAPRSVRRFVGRMRSRDPQAPPLGAPERRVAHVPAIFLIGCQRSGTSLLRRIVDSHPRIACPPETSFVQPLVQVLHDRRSTRGFQAMGYGP